MFITDEQLQKRLKNPNNLANRFFDDNKDEHNAAKTEDREKSGTPDGATLPETSIQFRTIKRPGNNRPWLSKSERTGIAADYARSTGNILEARKTQQEIAEDYGVQVSTVSDIVNDKRRVSESTRSVDQAKVEAALDKVREAAIDRLMAGLSRVTNEKIEAHNAKDISSICSNMARVVQQTIPQEKAAQQINLIVYTPELRAEKNFDVVEI